MANLFGALVNSSRQKSWMAPVDNRGGWWPWIGEPYAGAWQQNEIWTVDSVLAFPTVYACVTLIASDIGKLRPMLMQLGDDGIWLETSSTAFSPVMLDPNAYQNHIQFKEWWIISKLIRGNTYALKVRDNRGITRRQYILEPSRVLPLITSSGDVYYQLGQDNLRGVNEASITVPASEIIHDRINPIYHPLVGVSPLYACGEAATAGLQIIKDSGKFFKNGAAPGGVLTAPGAISDATAARLKDHWDKNYTGDNAGKVAVLGDGLTFEPMRMSALDSQTAQQLQSSGELVCSVFHVPAYKVGVGPPPARNLNIEALTQEYYTQCLQKLIEDYELCMDEGLALPANYRTELDLDGLFRMDSATMMEVLSAGVKGSILAPNEARGRINRRPLVGGDTIYMQQQNYSLEALAKRDAAADPFGTAKPALPPPPIEAPASPTNPTDAQDQSKIFALAAR